jgi:hypothetical protein
MARFPDWKEKEVSPGMEIRNTAHFRAWRLYDKRGKRGVLV